jgi:hypothetical protein
MLWLTVLIAVAALIGLVTFSGIQIKGARPVGKTNLMTVARVLLVIVLAVVLLYTFGVFK